MYLLVDLNQVLISHLLQGLTKENRQKLDATYIRQSCINTIRLNVKQFKSKYPNVILCCDNKHYWRKEVFPFYKAHRKLDREASDLDWTLIFNTLNKVRDELRENFPYIVLDVDGAEADDIIGVLAPRLALNGSVLILSGDKDFGQLQKYKNVDQYSPILNRYIKVDDPHRFVKEHILRGDRGDGIPNFLSPDNTFVIKERQKRLNSKKLSEWVNQDESTICGTEDVLIRGYKRNQTLIDLDYIPREVQERVVNSFDNAVPQKKSKMLDYFVEHGMTPMIESITDF